MAKYNIVGLNQMNVGSKRAFFNIDIKPVSSDIEKQQKIFFSEFGPLNTQFKNDFISISGYNNVQYTPMYDIEDASIKQNDDIGYKNSNINAENTFVNIYAPDMDGSPMGLVHIQNGQYGYTYTVTQPSMKEPYIIDSKLDNSYLDSNAQMYKIENENTNTFLYQNPNDKPLSTDMDILSAFEPERNIRGIKRNYILRFPESQINSEYDTGNTHAEILATKNNLNSEYEMEFEDRDKTINNRKYCGIGQSGNRIYLKYYDSADYTIFDTLNGETAQESDETKFPYQKIEFLDINTFTNRCKHKSNLFSIKIPDINELNESYVSKNEQTDDTINISKKIKDDLYYAILDIVNNICPVNTQLFNVYFGD